MEIAIGICIGIIFALMIGRGKTRHKSTSSIDASSVQTARKRLQQTDEELITVILPTINRDK
jgi:hypothetical protein